MQTRAKATTSVPVHDLTSSPSAPTSVPAGPAPNSSPVRIAPHTRSRGPAAPPVPLESITAQPNTRTPLIIRLPRSSTANVASSTINNATVTSVPTTSLPVPAPVISAPTSTPAPSAQTPDQPIYTFPPPPPPPPQTTPSPSHADTSSLTLSPAPAPPSADTTGASPLNGPPNTSSSHVPGARAPRSNLRHRAQGMTSEEDNSRRLALLKTILLSPPVQPSPQPPVQPSPQPPVQPSPQPPVQPSPQPPVQPSPQPPAQAPAQPSPQFPATLPVPPESNTDLEFNYYVPEPMDVDSEGISTAVNSPNEVTNKHREANKKYRQRLKERRRNGEIDEVEDARRKERQRINSRNSRARRKARKGTLDDGSMSSDPVQLTDAGVFPSADTTPAPGDFLLDFSDTRPPAGPTTFHEILAKSNSANSDSTSTSTSTSFQYYVPECTSTPLPSAHLSSAHFPSASLPSVPHPSAYLPSGPLPSSHLPSGPLPFVPFRSSPFPTVKYRDFRDAGIMTEPVSEPTKQIEMILDPIPPALARHPHRQLTPERLREFQMNPLELIDKAFLLIIPDQGSSLGKLILCRVIELRVSSAGHRFLVQFWGDRMPTEVGIEKMFEVLGAGYEIDPPPANAEPQTPGLTGRIFGALRSLTGF